MKKLSTLFVALFFVIIVSAQPCPDSLYLTSQAQVDSFQILYPNCTEIEGDVVIIGDDITNLNGLIVLTSVGGGLLIGKYEYGGNDSLTSLTGLDNVTSVGEGLYIGDNAALSSLTGLDNVTSVGGGLVIYINAALNSLAELDNVTSVGGVLYIWGNGALSSLAGLDNVTFVGGDLRIGDNNVLASLSGIDNINSSSIQDLVIYDNPTLSECEVLSICEYLAAPNGTAGIFDNEVGCNSPEEVQDSCEANAVNIGEFDFSKSVSIYPNPSSTQITIELPTTPQKNTSLTIYNLNGQQLITQPITEPQTVVDVSGLPKGVYFVKVVDDGTVMVKKLVVE